MALDTSITIRLKDQLTRGLKRMRTGVDEFKKDFQRAQRSFELAGHLSNAADGVESLSRSARGMVESVVRPAVEFEESIVRLGGLTGEAGENLERLEEKAKELGSTTRFSASEAATGMQDLARAGLDTDEILANIKPTMDLATAGGLDLSRAGAIATNIMGGFGLEVSETQRSMDTLVSAANSADTDVRLLGDTMKFVAPVSKAAGVSLEETAAAASVLASNGIKGSEAGTALRAMLLRIQTPSKQGKKALEELGVQVEDADGNFRGFKEVLGELDEGLKDVSGTRRQQILKDLFETEAVSAANVLVEAGGSGELQTRLKGIVDDEGISQRFSEQLEETTSGGLKAFESQMESLKITIGEELLPVVNDLLEDLKPIIEDIRDWVKENPELVRSLGSFLIKLAAITAALSPLIRAFAALQVVVGTTKTAIAGAKGLTAAMTGASSATGTLNSKLGKAGLVGAAAAASVAIGTMLRSWAEDAAAAERRLGAQTWVGDVKEFFGLERQGLGSRAARKLEEQGLSDAEINRELRGGRITQEGFVGASGDLIVQRDPKEVEQQQDMARQMQREQDLKLVRDLAQREATAGIVRGARSEDEEARERAEAALEARGLTDEQVERIVKAMRESRQEIQVTVDASSGEEVDSGRQPPGGG